MSNVQFNMWHENATTDKSNVIPQPVGQRSERQHSPQGNTSC